jgi:hypothetical protein
MEYKSGKLKMIPYEEKDQFFLVQIVAESPQGFLVSDILVNALKKKCQK